MASKAVKNSSRAAKSAKTKSKTKTPRTSTKPNTTRSRTPKPEDAVNSAEFQRAKSKAEEYARDPQKAKKLLDEAVKKARGKNKGPLGEVWRYLTALIRLVRAYTKGIYREVPWQTVVLAIAALIYFVSPIDLIPDFIPVAGWLDDAAVISFVVASIKADLDNFLEWEDDQKLEEDEQTG